jgi:SAM-dependent methyltransferase
VDTGGLIGGGDLAVGHRHDASITGYAGVAPSRLRASLEVWRGTLESQDLEERYTFVDVGCGKGRALLVASERGFREVVGVELHPGLAAVAERNAERWMKAGRARCGIRVVCDSAVEFALPAGDCLVFLYNPFGKEVMRELAQALRAHAGAVDVIYQNAELDAVLTGEGLHRLWMLRLPISEEDAAADPVAAAEDVTAGYRKP